MQARVESIQELAPEGYAALRSLEVSLRSSGVSKATLNLLKLRASQINGCGFCVDMHAKEAKNAGETDERLFAVAAWREAPYFSEPERAAFALAEAATRIADNPDGVPDDVWHEAAKHYEKEQLATLVLAIAAINAWNRISVTLRRPAGAKV